MAAVLVALAVVAVPQAMVDVAAPLAEIAAADATIQYLLLEYARCSRGSGSYRGSFVNPGTAGSVRFLATGMAVAVRFL